MNATAIVKQVMRNRAMQDEYDAGATVKEIAAKYGLCHDRVRVILGRPKRRNIPRSIGIGCTICRKLAPGTRRTHDHPGQHLKFKMFFEAGESCPACGAMAATWQGGPVFCMNCGWTR